MSSTPSTAPPAEAVKAAEPEKKGAAAPSTPAPSTSAPAAAASAAAPAPAAAAAVATTVTVTETSDKKASGGLAARRKKDDASASASSDDDSVSSEKARRPKKERPETAAKKHGTTRKEKVKSSTITANPGSPGLFLKKADEKSAKAESGGGEGAVPALKISQEKLEDEELEAMRLNPVYAKKTDLKVPLPVYEAYQKIAEFASTMYTSWDEAEVVFVGPRGSGKTTLIESILGHPVSVVREDASNEGTSRRPLFIHMLNNLSCEEPRVTIKREQAKAKGELSRDKVVKIEELPAELEKRNALSSANPIRVIYEWRYTWNLTLIDTPGLMMDCAVSTPDTSVGSSTYSRSSDIDTLADRQKAKLDRAAVEMVTPPHRLIVAVEQSQKWEDVQMVDWVRRVDPRRSRTIFVYTKFFRNTLRNMATTKDLNHYFAGAPINGAFFVSVFSAALRAKLIPDRAEYATKVKLASQRDMNLLEQLKYDKNYSQCLEIHSFKKYILEKTWKLYYDNIPKLLTSMNSEKSETTKKMERVMRELEDLKLQNLRSIAATYLMEFLHAVSRLIVGTSEGMPSLYGSTAEDERHMLGEWIDSSKEIIKVKRKWKLPYLDIKLYGGQQFERLLSEFKMVVEHTATVKATSDELANACQGKVEEGSANGCSIDQLAWAASDAVQRHSQLEFYPLIQQLGKRAVHIFQHLGHVAENMVESKRKAYRAGRASSIDEIEHIDVATGGLLDKVENFPYFKKKVLELYEQFVERRSQYSMERSMDEFHCTRLIYWELSNFDSLPDAYTSRGLESVAKLAESLWEDMRTRIAHNVALKCHHFFLVPMEMELPYELQSHFSCLSGEQIEEIFEVHPIRERLTQELTGLKARLAKSDENIKSFTAAASSFSNSFSL